MTIPSPLQAIVDRADVRINGDHPWDLQVHDERLFARIIHHGTIGLGEAYMDGWWDCDEIDELVARILRSSQGKQLPLNATVILEFLRFKLFNLQSTNGARKVAEQHYNLGNDFYEAMLDPYMQYSCGYFKDTNSLAVAEEQKLDLICRKLQLEKGMKLLDIGCGWGGLARFAAERYGAHVTGINISTEQIAYAQKRCEGLPVEIRECDYRKIEGTFDRVVSVGMFEHVGPKNYDTYMNAVRKALPDDGFALIHTIGSNTLHGGPDPWIEKYIFPNSILPTPSQVIDSAIAHFVLEDWHNFGAYYDKTLMSWYHNFIEHWPQFSDRYGDRFKRMWTFYLLSCAGAFRARSIQLWQLVLSPHGIPGGYQSIR